MPPGELRPVPDEPLLELASPDGSERWLLLADLHLGLQPTDGRGDDSGRAAAQRLADHLVGVGRRRRATHLLVAGDVKHPIVGAPPALRGVLFDFFSTVLGSGLGARVVLGNHDVGLARHLPREVEVDGPEGAVLHGVGIFHGHRWPSDAVLRAPRLVAGHLHPGVRLAPTAEATRSKVRCWVRVEFPEPGRPDRRRRRHASLRARELVILPAFNPLCGAEALNRERPARGRSFLFHRFVGRGEARAYLLDGTDLGRIVTPRGAAPHLPGRPRSPSAP